MRYWASAVLALFFYASNAQTIPYLKYGVQDGLGNSLVYNAFQDSKGYMWFCTDHGLSRFDGQHFTNYTTADGFPTNHIMSVAETSDGEIWAAVYGYGVYKLDHGKFTILRPDVPEVPRFLLTIAADKQDKIWMFNGGIGTKEVWYIEKGSYKKFSINKYTGDTLQYIYYDVYTEPGGGILLGTNHGLFEFQDEKIKPLLSKDVIYRIDADKNGNLWLGSDGKILEYSPSKTIKIITNECIKGIAAAALGVDYENRLWIGDFPHHLFVISGNDGRLLYSDDLPVNNFLLDRENNMWATTFGQGVFCFNYPDIINYTVRDGLANNIIVSEAEDSKGKLWIGTLRGINYLINDGSGENKMESFIKVDELFGFAIVNDVIVYETGLHLITIKNGVERMVTMKNRMISLYTDSHNTIWIATTKGVACYRNDSLLYPAELSILDDKKVFAITTDGDDKLWIGTDEGVYCYANKVLNHYTTTNGLSNNTVNYIWQDVNKRMWFATDEGISILDKGKWVTDSLLRYISNITCTAITADSNGNTWIGTSNGLFIYGDGRIQKLDDKTGLAGVEIQSLYLDKQNNLWVGTLKGLSKINLNEYSHIINSYSPQIYIQNVKVNDKAIGTPDSVPLVLKYSDNNISISYVGLYFKNPQALSYEYKLSGTSDKWRKVSGNILEFSSLSPGTYKFGIRAISPDCVYSKAPAYFSFRILPPYWMQPWFIFLETLLLILVLVVLFRWRLRVLKRRALLKEELQNAKRTLDDYTRTMIEKNELLEQFKEDIEKLKQEVDLVKIEQLDHLNKATILTEEEWARFTGLFESVHQGFFARLKEKLPDLTQAEIRLVCLTKLKLGTKHMAGILGVSPNTIKMTRHRLRKKMGLAEEDSISDIAESI